MATSRHHGANPGGMSMKHGKQPRVGSWWAIAAITMAIPLVVSCSAGSGADGTTGEGVANTSSAVTSNVVPDRYIVVLKKGTAQPGITGRGVPDIAAAIQTQFGGTVVRTY